MKYVYKCSSELRLLEATNLWFVMTLFLLTQDLPCPEQGPLCQPEPPREEYEKEVHDNHDEHVT